MLERIALFVASLTAALVIAVAVVAAGVNVDPAARPTPAAATITTDQPSGQAVQVDTVYLTTPLPTTVTVHRTVAQATAGGDDEGEGGDDD